MVYAQNKSGEKIYTAWIQRKRKRKMLIGQVENRGVDMFIKKFFIVIFSILISHTASAFDDSRKGFMLGLGGGFHNIDTDVTFSGNTISDSSSGFATSFKIGAGITDQFLLYYVRNASWYSDAYSDGFYVYDITKTVGITGLGGSYYLSPTAPSGYVLGAFGIGDLSAPFEEDIESETGSALMFGGGYEFSEHLHLEATLLTTDIDSSSGSAINFSSSSLQFTINYLWY